MDLPVIETNIRATLKRKPRKCLQGIGGKEPGLYYHMQPRKWQVAFYYIIELMEWITALTVLIHLAAVGAFTGDEWYSPSNLPYHLAVFFFHFSPLLLFFKIIYCWCCELPFLPSSHLDIRPSAASEPGSYTPCLRCQLSDLWAQCHWSLQAVLQGAIQTLAAVEWKGRMRNGFKSLPFISKCYITHGSEAWHVTCSN